MGNSVFAKFVLAAVISAAFIPSLSAATGSINASPNPCSVTTLGGTCTLTLSWSTTGTSAAQVWVTPFSGSQTFIASGTSGSYSANWIQALPQYYTFQLYAYSGSTRGQLLASVNVSVPSPQLSLTVQPSSSQTLNQGQTMSFTVTVRDPSGAAVSGANVAIQDGVQGGSLQNVTTNGSGQATYGYSIPTQVTPGTYTMTFGPATKSGYNQSSTTSVSVTVNGTALNLNVTPSGSQTLTPGQSVNYSITVTDSNGNGVSGAAVPVANPLGSNTSVTTASGGSASYTVTVPSAQTSGSYTVTFGGASKNGYLTSALVQRTVVVNAAQPLLTLSVSPSALQTVSAGQAVNYTLTVQDGNGAAISGASITITNPFTGTNNSVTTGAGGTASYSLAVPSTQGAATYTVFFSGASKSGYTSSSGTQTQITVQPSQNPTAVLSLSAQGNTVGNDGTLTVSATSGGSVNVSFSATGSAAGTGTITSYAWTSNGTAIGGGQASFSAPFGTASNNIALTVTNSAGLSATATAKIIVNFTSSATLSLSVQPNSAQTFNQGDTMSFTLTVRDQSSNPVNAANIAIQDGVQGGVLKSATTNASGQATYSYSIPTLVTPGTYTMTFGPATASGYTQSGTTSVQITVNAAPTALSLNVTPSSSQTVSPGQSVNYSITVNDANGNGVSGASVPIANPLGSNTSVTTATGGTASYTVAVLSGQASGSYTVSFGGASKSGYLTSALVQRTIVVNGAQPLLTLSVSPSALQTVSAGQTVNYTLTVQDGNAAATSGASITITNPFTGTNSSVTTGAGGTASYSLVVPSTQGAATYTVFFSGASKSGYTSSAGTQTQVTVQPGNSGPSFGTLSANPPRCQVTTSGGTCTITLAWTLKTSTAGEITVVDVLGNNKVVGLVNGTSGSYPIPWIQGPPQSYTFYLWDYSTGSQGAKLANIGVAATGPNSNTVTSSVGVSPTKGAPGTAFSVNGAGLAAGPASIYVQPPGGSGAVAGQVTASADGTFSGFSYGTSSSSTSGTYSVWAVDSKGTKSASATFSLGQQTPATIANCQSNSTNSGCNGDPINTATGNYTYQRTDLSMPGIGLPFAFTRTYNSENGAAGPIGFGWSHSYMASLTLESDGSIQIVTPDEQLLIFDPVGSTFVSRFNNVYSTLQTPAAGTYVLTTKAQISYTFQNTLLTSVSDRNGNAIQLAYANGALSTITDSAGRRITISADSSGRIIGIVDAIGRSLQYQYDTSGNLASFSDARGGRFVYTYDGTHRMLTAVDPGGNTFLTNTYDSSGRVATQADGNGSLWSYSYNDAARVTTITDPNGKVSSHRHDSNYQLLVATDTFGKTDQYQYDGSGNRISAQDRNGNSNQFGYDQNGNVLTSTDPQSHIQSAAYNAQSNVLSRSDALGNMSSFLYDANGNLTTTTDPVGNKTNFSYDAHGQLLSKTDPLGNTTRYTYDSRGNLVQSIDPLGNKTTYAYDGAGRRISTTDANGFTTTTEYDANGNVVSVTDALANKTQYSYDANNNRTKITDPRGKTTTYSYDANYKLISTINALGGTLVNSYDKLRNLASVTDQLGNLTRYNYDSENRLVSRTDALGNTTQYGYDAASNRTTVTDPLGNVTTYSYDSLNRLVSVKNALGNTTTTAYDADGHTVKKTDAVGNPTTYAYDAMGRQLSIADAAGGVVSFQYDGDGNRTEITDARSKTTQFAYDGNNRLTTTTDPLGNVTTNQYDAVGNLAKLTDGNGNTKNYTYDGDRRQTGIAYSTGGGIQYSYDANGNRTGMVDLIGTSTYSYDDLNRLHSYTSPAGAVLGFTYDAASNRTALRYPGGNAVQYGYDADNRISKVTDWTSLAVTYSYDPAGRITVANYSNGLTSTFVLDSVGQNLNIRHSNGTGVFYSEATTWSANGNPTSSDISGLNSPGFASSRDIYAYNDAGELSSATYGAPVSDKNGNLTSQPTFSGVTTFTYDQNNRVTSIAGPAVSAAMKYFGDGKLAEIDSAAASHRYLLDPISSGNHILAELDSNGGIQIGYTYGPLGMVAQILGGQSYPYFHNLQGSTIAVVDAAGSIKNRYFYDPFGQKLSSSTENISNQFGFLGSYSIPSLLQFSLTTYRVYDSREGRFLGADLISQMLQDGANWYIYGHQSPVKEVDSTGLDSTDTNIERGAAASRGVFDVLMQYVEDSGAKIVPNGAGEWLFVSNAGAKTIAKVAGRVITVYDVYKDVTNSKLSAGQKTQAVIFDLASSAAPLWGTLLNAASSTADPTNYEDEKTRYLSISSAGGDLYDANGNCLGGAQAVCDAVARAVPAGTVIPLGTASPGSDYSALGLQGEPILGNTLQGNKGGPK